MILSLIDVCLGEPRQFLNKQVFTNKSVGPAVQFYNGFKTLCLSHDRGYPMGLMGELTAHKSKSNCVVASVISSAKKHIYVLADRTSVVS